MRDRPRLARSGGGTASESIDEDIPRSALRDHLGHALSDLHESPGAAARIARLLPLDEPPMLDAGEIATSGRAPVPDEGAADRHDG